MSGNNSNNNGSNATNSGGKKTLSHQSSKDSATSINSNPASNSTAGGSGKFLAKTFPNFFNKSQQQPNEHHLSQIIESADQSANYSAAATPKKDRFKLRKILSVAPTSSSSTSSSTQHIINCSFNSSTDITSDLNKSPKSLLLEQNNNRNTNYNNFFNNQKSSSINSSVSSASTTSAAATTTTTSTTDQISNSSSSNVNKKTSASSNGILINAVNGKKKKHLTHQALSLSSAFSSISSSHVSNVVIAPHSTVTSSLMSSSSLNSNSNSSGKLQGMHSPTVPEKTTIIQTTPNSTTVISSYAAKTTLFTSGLLFSRNTDSSRSQTSKSKNSKTNYKERIKSMNVRRKSSTINASCFSSFDRPCLLNQPTTSASSSSKQQHQTKAMAKTTSTTSTLNDSLIAKAAKRGSIHFYQPLDIKRNSNGNIGVCLGVNDIKFRKKLLKLQQQQQAFVTAASTLLTTGVDRRKKAFVVDNMSILSDEMSLSGAEKQSNLDYDEYDDNDDDDDDEMRTDNLKSESKRLSHAISSLVSFGKKRRARDFLG